MPYRISAPPLFPYRPPLFSRSGRMASYPGFRNEAVFKPLRFFVCDGRSGQKPGRFAGGLLAAAQRNASAYARQSLCERNGKRLAANRCLRFSLCMSGTDSAGSKLSAFITRQSGNRPNAGFLIELGKGGTPVASPMCRLRRHAETVPVSAPFGLPPGFRQAAAFRPVEVRP
jgi:hypothetical protein